MSRAAQMRAMVTGGASGIGREVVVRLRDAGHDVVVWDQTGGDIECDISDPAAVTAAMSQTVREHGAPTRVVACAGIGAAGIAFFFGAAFLTAFFAFATTFFFAFTVRVFFFAALFLADVR